jgi:hypothetical protein
MQLQLAQEAQEQIHRTPLLPCLVLILSFQSIPFRQCLQLEAAGEGQEQFLVTGNPEAMEGLVEVVATMEALQTQPCLAEAEP